MSTFYTCQTGKFVATEPWARQLLASALPVNPLTFSNQAEPMFTTHDGGRSAVACDVPSARQRNAIPTNQRSQRAKTGARS